MKVLHPDKSPGDQMTAAEQTQVKTAVNTNDDLSTPLQVAYSATVQADRIRFKAKHAMAGAVAITLDEGSALTEDLAIPGLGVIMPFVGDGNDITISGGTIVPSQHATIATEAGIELMLAIIWSGSYWMIGIEGQSGVAAATLLSDTFTAANGVALAAHNPEIGPAGASQSGVHEIQSNKLTASSNGTALWNVAQADVDISAILNVSDVANQAIIYGRWGDIANGDNRIIATWSNANTLLLQQAFGGVLTTIGTAPALTYTTGDHTIRMILSGNNVRVLIDNVEIRNETITLLTGGYIGYFIKGANTLDNLTVTPI